MDNADANTVTASPNTSGKSLAFAFTLIAGAVASVYAPAVQHFVAAHPTVGTCGGALAGIIGAFLPQAVSRN